MSTLESLRTLPPATLVRARAGEILTLNSEPHALWSSCGGPATRLACLPCSQLLANITQLEMHVERGTHVIAGWCPRHGWEALDESPLPTGGARA